MARFFCRECGKEIQDSPISVLEKGGEAVRFFAYKPTQNQYVCQACWEAYQSKLLENRNK